jgi:hypothetical protein
MSEPDERGLAEYEAGYAAGYAQASADRPDAAPAGNGLCGECGGPVTGPCGGDEREALRRVLDDALGDPARGACRSERLETDTTRPTLAPAPEREATYTRGAQAVRAALGRTA